VVFGWDGVHSVELGLKYLLGPFVYIVSYLQLKEKYFFLRS
jgi:hypothetical protein